MGNVAGARRYEQYLDSQITGRDMYYLEDVEVVRHLVELGCAAPPLDVSKRLFCTGFGA